MAGNKDTADDDDQTTTNMATTRESNGKGISKRPSKKQDDDKVTRMTVTVAPPDGGWGWIVVAASFGISLLVDGVCFSFGIFFDEFRSEFGTSKSMTSWIGSVLNGSYLTLGPIVSALVNMYGCRRVAVGGALLSFLSFFISTFSPNIGVLIFTYGFLGGLGFGLMYLPAIVMVGYYFERRRALATGIACSGSGIGTFLFAPFTEYLLHKYGWRGANWILAALVLHSVAFAIFFRPLTEARPAGKEVKTGKTADEAAEPLVPSALPNTWTTDITDIVALSNMDRDTNTSPVISDNLKQQILQGLQSDMHKPRARTLSMQEPSSPTESQNDPNGASKTARLAFSQDLTSHHLNRRSVNVSRRDASMPPLQRKDIFYSGSLWQLKEFQEVGSVQQYRRKVSESSCHGERAASAETVTRANFFQSFISVFDVSLLRSPTFLIYGCSCFLCMAGFFVPFVYMPTHALDMGLDTVRAAYLIAIIGIANTVARVVVGFVSDQPWADCLLINNVALICGGLATLFVPFYLHFYLLAIYAAVFGTSIAIFVSLRSIIMVDLMGLERLTTAFGFVIMCQGISSLLGPPIAGTISDFTGNYNASFYLAGVAMTLSGAICLPLRRVARWENARNSSATTNYSSDVLGRNPDSENELQTVRTSREGQAMI